MSWDKVKLGDVIEKPISGEWGEEGDGVFVLRTTNFSNDGSLDLKNVVKRIIDADKVAKKKLRIGDTIIEKSGGSPAQPVGRVVYFNIETVNGDIYLCNNFTSVLRPTKKVNPKYLFWFLFNNHVTKQTLRYQNKTTGIINLQTERYLNELQIPLPPLLLQQKIAAILDQADTLRKKDKQLLAKYDELLQAVFYDMFGDPVTSEKYERKSFKSISTVRQGLQIPIANRKKEAGEGRYPYITNQFINGGKIAEYVANPRPNVTCKKDDVLMTRTGNTGIVLTDVEGVFHNNFFLIDYKRDEIDKQFLVCFLRQQKVKQLILKKASTTTIPDLNHGDFYEITLPVPPLQIQNRFSAIAENIQQQKEHLKQQMQKSEALFQSLLQRAFKGELVTE